MKNGNSELIVYKSFKAVEIKFPTTHSSPKPALKYLLAKDEVKELLDKFWPQCDSRDMKNAHYKQKAMGHPIGDRDFFALKLREWDADNDHLLAPFEHISNHGLANHVRSLLSGLEDVEMVRNGAVVSGVQVAAS